MTGLSLRNLRYMRAFCPRVARREPVFNCATARCTIALGAHNVTLLDKLEDRDFRLWYQGNALTSFDHALPESDSKLLCLGLLNTSNVVRLRRFDTRPGAAWGSTRHAPLGTHLTPGRGAGRSAPTTFGESLTCADATPKTRLSAWASLVLFSNWP